MSGPLAQEGRCRCAGDRPARGRLLRVPAAGEHGDLHHSRVGIRTEARDLPFQVRNLLHLSLSIQNEIKKVPSLIIRKTIRILFFNYCSFLFQDDNSPSEGQDRDHAGPNQGIPREVYREILLKEKSEIDHRCETRRGFPQHI